MAGVLRYGLRKRYDVITILVVSTDEFCNKILSGIIDCSAAKHRRIRVHTCESITQVLAHQQNLQVDFIVFGFDSRLKGSLEEVKDNIALVDQSFILYGSSCLVDGNDIPPHAKGVTAEKISEIRNKYNLRFLKANLFDPEDCLSLGNSIITLAAAVTGFDSGYPILNSVNQYHQMFYNSDSLESA